MNTQDRTLPIAIVALIAIAMAIAAIALASDLGALSSQHSPAAATGGGCNDANEAGIRGDPIASHDAASDIVTGVCIKSGVNMFNGGHSGILDNGTFENGCYQVSGVGTSEVTVERISQESSTCQAISHIDVYTGPAPTLTVIKVVVNDDGGTAAVSDFSLRVDSDSVTSGVANSVFAGPRVVSEDDAGADYTATISGDCDASGNVTLAAGENKTCTIINNDVPPTTTTTTTTTPTPTPTPTPAPAVLGETQVPQALPATGGSPEEATVSYVSLLLGLAGLTLLSGAGTLVAVAARRRR